MLLSTTEARGKQSHREKDLNSWQRRLGRPGPAAPLPRPLRPALHLLGFPARAQRTVPQADGTSGEGEGSPGTPQCSTSAPGRPRQLPVSLPGSCACPRGEGGLCAAGSLTSPGATCPSQGPRLRSGPGHRRPRSRPPRALSETEADAVTWASPARCEPPAQAPPGAACFAARENRQGPGFSPRQLWGWGAGMGCL